MDGLAVIGAVFLLIVVGYIGVSAVLRRIPATSLRLPTGPIPDTWDGIVEHNVPLARGLSSDERERLLRLVQAFLTDKHFAGCRRRCLGRRADPAARRTAHLGRRAVGGVRAVAPGHRPGSGVGTR